MIKFKIFRLRGMGILDRNSFDILIDGHEDYEKIYDRFKEQLLAHTFNVRANDNDLLANKKLTVFPTALILKPQIEQADSFFNYQLENFNRQEAEKLLYRIKYDFRKEEKQVPWDKDAENYRNQSTLPRFYAIQSILPIIEKYSIKKPQCKKAPFVFDQKFSEHIVDVLINEVAQDTDNLDAFSRFVENTLTDEQRVNFTGEVASLCYFFFHLEKFGKLHFRGDLKIQKAIRKSFQFNASEPTDYVDKLFKKSAQLERTPLHVSNALLKNNPNVREQLIQLGFLSRNQ